MFINGLNGLNVSLWSIRSFENVQSFVEDLKFLKKERGRYQLLNPEGKRQYTDSCTHKICSLISRDQLVVNGQINREEVIEHLKSVLECVKTIDRLNDQIRAVQSERVGLRFILRWIFRTRTQSHRQIENKIRDAYSRAISKEISAIQKNKLVENADKERKIHSLVVFEGEIIEFLEKGEVLEKSCQVASTSSSSSTAVVREQVIAVIQVPPKRGRPLPNPPIRREVILPENRGLEGRLSHLRGKVAPSSSSEEAEPFSWESSESLKENAEPEEVPTVLPTEVYNYSPLARKVTAERAPADTRPLQEQIRNRLIQPNTEKLKEIEERRKNSFKQPPGLAPLLEHEAIDKWRAAREESLEKSESSQESWE